MATEIYLQPELEELVIDTEKKDEWIEKVRTLELEGQLNLTKNSNNKDSASPYTFMNEQMELVFSTLCPTRSTVEKYGKSAIPIEVLSHIALCKQEKYFNKIEIWYDNKKADPVAIGYIGDSYRPIKHLIARWGDEIVPYEQLLEKAVHRYTQGFELSLQAMRNECDATLSNAKMLVNQLFAGQKHKVSIEPHFSFQLENQESLPF